MRILSTLTIGALLVAAISAGCGGAQIERVRIMDTDLVAEIEKRHAHLFLAEYDFTLRLKEGATVLDSVEMTGDSGGLSRIDVLQVDGDRLVFRDHARAECVSVARKVIENCPRETGRNQIGYFDFDASRRWRFIGQDLGG